MLLPVALAFAGAIALIWYRPAGSPERAVWCAVGFQAASHVLTAFLWGPWQAKLSSDPLGPASPQLTSILSTHWIRTMLISAYGFTLLVWAERGRTISMDGQGPCWKQVSPSPLGRPRRRLLRLAVLLR